MYLHHCISHFGRASRQFSLDNGYFEVLWTQCYWISVCFYIFTLLFALCWAYAHALKSSCFIILLIILPFAACWVHTRYSACTIHSCETCVLNSAAICCRKRTQPLPDTLSYVLFMLQTLYSICFSWLISLLFTVISHRDHIAECLSQFSCFYCYHLITF